MEINMNVKFNLKRKYIVNGKEYGSVKEMPDNIRQVYEKALDSSLATNPGTNPGNIKKKIMFNGQEYENVEAMPPDVRQTYDELIRNLVEMKGLSSGAVARKPISFSFSKSTTPEPVISPRVLAVVILVLVLFGALYFLYQKGRGR
ncbi:MAG: hypothetical protein NTY10_07195 [Candidatus Omnitrophica bacterium]|nr:hypothetical protein [Candidatus Omnitrophota bacterium]